MSWADAPVFSNDYQISTTSDDKYTPGQLINVYVKVLTRAGKFTGLLLNGVDSKNQTVGSWEFPKDSKDSYYWSPPICPSSAYHTSAVVKPYTSLLRYRTPSTDVGPITFQTLIKQGPANRGSFFYAPFLTITADPFLPSGEVVWQKTQPGQSCADYCLQQGLYCNLEIGEVNSATKVATIFKNISCARPFMSGCSGAVNSPAMTTGGTCYFHDDTCPKPTCSSSDIHVSRLCRCTTNRPSEVPVSQGSKTSASLILALFLPVLVTLMTRRDVTCVLICLVVLIAEVEGHNWFHSESRSRKTAQSNRPCGARVGNTYHIQVGPSQNFTLAWATGHGATATIVLVKAENINQLRSRETLLNNVADYIKSAPEGSQLFNDRHHGTNNPNGPSVKIPDTNSYIPVSDFTKVTTLNSSKIVMEEGIARNRPISLWRPGTSYLAKDARVEYKSVKYPWMISVHQFPINLVNFEEFDQATFRIPTGSPLGHYILAWDWAGYNDCVDVELRSEPVPEDIIYGSGSTNFVYVQRDHCQYTAWRRMITTCSLSPTAEQAVKQLETWTDTQSVGINVIPMRTPENVVPFLQNTGIMDNVPWDSSQCQAGDALKLQGTVSESPNDWEAKWRTKRAEKPTFKCSGTILFTVSSLKMAILECTDSKCVGISTNGTHYLGCSGVVVGNSTWSAFVKNTTVVDLYSINNTWSHIATINFQPSNSSVSLPSQTYTDSGAVFGPKNGLEYGWVTCPHTRFDQNGTDLNSTWVIDLFQPCNCTFDQNGWAGTEPPKNCVRNKWEIKVDNGWYRVFGKAPIAIKTSILSAPSIRGCAIEGHRASHVEPSNGPTFIAIVEVTDGRLTLEDMAHYDCCAIYVCQGVAWLKIEQLITPISPLPAWFPATDNPWWQLELDRSKAIGVVSVKQPDNDLDCRGAWLWREGSYCLEKPQNINYPLPVASGWFDGLNNGAVVGVSNSSCNGQSCTGGVVCGKLLKPPMYGGYQNGVSHSVQQPVDMRNIVTVDCAGKVGKYVYVQLPGKGRILLADVRVSEYRPTSDHKDTFVSYGVWAIEGDEANPEFVQTDDPEDPIFYSTCFSRQRDLRFLPPATPEQPAADLSFIFNGLCLSCEVFKANQSPRYLTPKQWPFTDQCKSC